MKVKVLSRKLIKPSTPTPNRLRKFRIAFTDEMAPTMMGPMIFYYHRNIINGKADDTKKFKKSLEESLAQVLPQFYPLAGRYIKESYFIDCADQGAEYLEAQVDCPLFQLLGPSMKPEQLNHLLPCAFGAADEATDPILSIQVSEFECGGIAIAVCISHRIADASTASTFISAWANTNLGDQGSENIYPSFNSPNFFPGRNLSKLELGIPRTMDRINGPTIVTKRFVFNGKAISSIRAKLISSNGILKRQPTRVQLVSGLILRAFLGVDREKNGHSGAFLVLQTVDIREKTIPPLPKHSCGNFCVFAKAQCTAEEIDTLGLEGCVHLVGNALRKTVSDCSKILGSGEDGQMMVIKPFEEVTKILYNDADQPINAILMNSWCRFPLYTADFGWGKPAWVSIASLPARNSVVFMDTREGDGIEAWVILDERDMSIFEQDEDIKTFTN